MAKVAEPHRAFDALLSWVCLLYRGPVPDPDALPIHDQIEGALADPIDGQWVSAALDAFGYLEADFAFRLTKVHRHFRGTYLLYEGDPFDLVIEHDPQDTGRIQAQFRVHDDLVQRAEHPRAFSVNAVLRTRDPNLALPDEDRGALGHAEVSRAIAVWAAGLKELAPDVLRGAWPDGVGIGYLW